MSERYTIRESSLRRDLRATSARAEIAESELSTKDEEVRELRDSRLLFKKKVSPLTLALSLAFSWPVQYHALKQKQSQSSRTPVDADMEDSLVILR